MICNWTPFTGAEQKLEWIFLTPSTMNFIKSNYGTLLSDKSLVLALRLAAKNFNVDIDRILTNKLMRNQ